MYKPSLCDKLVAQPFSLRRPRCTVDKQFAWLAVWLDGWVAGKQLASGWQVAGSELASLLAERCLGNVMCFLAVWQDAPAHDKLIAEYCDYMLECTRVVSLRPCPFV